MDLSEDGKEVGTADPFLKKEENPLLVRELAFCSAKQVGGMVTWK